MNYLITGGAGFIGGNFCNYLVSKIQKNDFVVILDALTYAGNKQRIMASLHSSQFKFIHGNICDKQLIDKLFAEFNFDKVIHFAAESHVDKSIADPSAFIQSNITGTFVLLEAVRKHWEGCFEKKLFLHVSTDEVFGDIPNDSAPVKDDAQYKPSSPYSASKAGSDHLVSAWHRTYGIPVITTHCTNNYGPWQYPEKLIPLMILNALAGKPLPVYGDGEQIRDWLHVEDHCSALWVLANKGTIGESYNISGDNEQANMNVVKRVCTLVDEIVKPAKSTHTLITHVEDRLGHDRRYALNCEKLKQEFQWRQQRDFASSLRELVQWYVANQSWVKELATRC